MGINPRFNVTDPATGKSYSIEWKQDREPTRWELLELMQQQKKAQEEMDKFTHPTIRGSRNTSLAPELEFGNKLADKARESGPTNPLYKWEGRTPALSKERKRSTIERVANIMFPGLSKTINNLRAYGPGQVNDPDIAGRVKSRVGEAIGEFTSDLLTPASLLFNVALGAGTRQWIRGARATRKSKKAFAARPKKAISAEDTITIATAKRGSKEWNAAARRLLDANDLFPGVDLDKVTVKAIGKRPKSKQLKLDLEGSSIDNAITPGPDVEKINPFTLKLKPDVLENFSEGVLPFLKSYVDRRNSADLIREMVGRRLGGLKDEGFNAVLRYQKGDRSGALADLQKMLDEDWIARRIVGDNSKYKFSYLHQMWDNTPEEIRKIFGLKKAPTKEVTVKGGRRASSRPAFTLESVFKDYAEGIAAGLKPKYDNIVDIVADYLVRSNNYQADKALINFLKANKLMVKEGPKSRKLGYKVVEQLPTFIAKSDKGRVVGHWAVHPDVAKYLKNYYGDPGEWAKMLGNWATFTKNIAMGAGIPKTIINAHGYNIFKRAFDYGGVKGARDYLTSGITQSGAKKSYDRLFSDPKSMKDLLDLSRRGYVANIAEDYRSLGGKTGLAFGDELRASKNPFFRTLGNTEKLLAEHIEKPLFGYKLPYTKAKMAIDRLDDLIAQGIPREQALRQVADEANTFFGGMNYVRNYDPTIKNPFTSGGMSRSMDQGVRSVILAPDWTGTNIKLGKNAYASLFGKADPIYAKAFVREAALRNVSRAGKFAGGLTAADVAREKPTESLLIPAGTVEEGKRRRQIDPFGTASEFIRLPDQILDSAWRGEFSPANKLLLNRLNPLTRSAVSLFFNRDYNENPIYGHDRWGNPIPVTESLLNLGKYLAAPLTHPVVANTIEYGLGNIGPEQAIMQSMELPIRYRYIPQGRGRRRETNPFKINFGSEFDNPFNYSF